MQIKFLHGDSGASYVTFGECREGFVMTRMVKDFIEISDLASLDGLIQQLTELRDSLGDSAQPELKMRGDDVFGRHLCVGFLRPQTAEEAECEARYADAYEASRERELSRLEDELGFCALPRGGRRGLRAVA